MQMSDLIGVFSNTETPFLLLFVILFVYFIRQAKSREAELRKENEELRKTMREDLGAMEKDIKIMLALWKTLLLNEHERRETKKND